MFLMRWIQYLEEGDEDSIHQLWYVYRKLTERERFLVKELLKAKDYEKELERLLEKDGNNSKWPFCEPKKELLLSDPPQKCCKNCWLVRPYTFMSNPLCSGDKENKIDNTCEMCWWERSMKDNWYWSEIPTCEKWCSHPDWSYAYICRQSTYCRCTN